MSLSPGDLTVDELARRCLKESERYLAGQSHDGTYCFELFRRAIFNHDQAAWQAVYAQYQALIAHWVRQWNSTGSAAGQFRSPHRVVRKLIKWQKL